MIEEYIYQINDYLPIDFGNEENNAYRQYIIDAFTENTNNKKYQISLLAFHLLFMTYVYKGFWILKTSDYAPVQSRCSHNRQLADIQNIFDMSILPEKNAIEHTMGVLGFHINHQSDVQNLVDIRDKCAHASGIIQYSCEDVKYHVTRALSYADRILAKEMVVIQKRFAKEIIDYWNSAHFIYSRSVNFAEELIKKLLLSPKEIEYLLLSSPDELLQGYNNVERLSREISFYMVISVLHRKYLDNSNAANLILSEDWLKDSLLAFFKKINSEERTLIQVELEDELLEYEKYGTLSLEEFEHAFENTVVDQLTLN